MSENEPETTKPVPVISYGTPQQSGTSVGIQIVTGIAMFLLWVVVSAMGAGLLVSLPGAGVFPPLAVIFVIFTLCLLALWVRRRKREGWRAIVPVMLTIFGVTILGFGTCAAYVIYQIR